MAGYEDKLNGIAELDAEGLKALETELVAAFDEADQADDLDAMSAAADALDTVRAKMAGDESPETESGEPAPAAVPESAPVAAAAEGKPDEDDDKPEFLKDKDDEDKDDEEDDKSVTASAGTDNQEGTEVDIPEDRKPVATVPAVAIVAGADLKGMAAGTTFENNTEIAEAMISRVDAIRGVRSGDGEKHRVATIVASVDPARTLIPGDLEGNAAKIEAVTGQTALVAAGGYCAPLEVKYDLFGLGSAERPVQSALAGFQAKRGGIRYNTPPRLGDYDDAVGLWTAANDADATPDPATKAKMIVECTPEQTAVVDAVTLQLQFGNLMARAYPEMVTRHNELGLITHARLAENTLLDKIDALSTAVTSGFTLGTARDFLYAVGRGAAAYRSRHRMGRTEGLRVLAPEWVLDAMREDLTRGLPGDNLELADARISGFFTQRNVTVSWHKERGFPATQAVGALQDFPATFKWEIFAEGTFLYLDGGTLDLGIVRDSTLISTNDYVMFVETFEGVARVGLEGITVTTTTRPAGGVSGTVDLVPEDNPA